MSDQLVLACSGLCVFAGVMMILFPKTVLKISTELNRRALDVDQLMIRHRYIVGLLLCAMSFGILQMALIIIAYFN